MEVDVTELDRCGQTVTSPGISRCLNHEALLPIGRTFVSILYFQTFMKVVIEDVIVDFDNTTSKMLCNQNNYGETVSLLADIDETDF